MGTKLQSVTFAPGTVPTILCRGVDCDELELADAGFVAVRKGQQTVFYRDWVSARSLPKTSKPNDK